MGCDCSMILQHREKDRWVDVEVIDVDRNYTLFGILAGVRSHVSRHYEYERLGGCPKILK